LENRSQASQKRKGEEAEAYLKHLIQVASLVAESTDGRQDVLIAALLHNAVEDQDVTIAEIADLFGQTVASLVAEVDRRQCVPKRLRKDQQIAAASHRPTAPPPPDLLTRQATCSPSLTGRRPGHRIANGRGGGETGDGKHRATSLMKETRADGLV
jgi:hypothetical protein